MESLISQDTVIIIASILVPLLTGGGVMKYRDMSRLNQRSIEVSVMKYRYDQLINFVETVSECLEDEKITAAETKIISRQLRGILKDGNKGGLM